MRWLVTIVVIAILAFLGYRYFYPEQGQQVAEQVEQAAEQAATAVEETAEEAAEAVGQAADEATEAVEGAVDQAADTAEQATDGNRAGCRRGGRPGRAGGDSATETAEESVAALTVGGVNLGEEVGTTVSDATSALEGITDKASAEAALPNLKAVETKLGELGGTVEGLPQQAKAALASLLDDSLPALQDLVSKVEGIEGVGEVVKPTLDGIMTKLDAWAKQPA